MLKLSKYMSCVRHSSYAFFLSLAIMILLSSSLFMSLNLDIDKHSVPVISSRGIAAEHAIDIKEVGNRNQVALTVKSSTKNGQLQVLLQENGDKKEKNFAKAKAQRQTKQIRSYLNQDSSCDGRRIYMYNLPPEFNSLILQECNNKIVDWLNFCPHFHNHGFGKAVNDSSNWADWYETDFYMLEVIFHSRMAVYPCLTRAAHEADAFFIPFYSGLDALHYLYGKKKKQRGAHGVKLVRWLMAQEGGKYWRRRGGHDHFIVMGRTAWDFTHAPTSDAEEGSGWGTSFARLPEMENVTALFIERRPWGWLEQAIPYPTGFHPTSLQTLHAWQDKVLAAQRPFLLAFVGGPRPRESSPSQLRHTRQAAIDQCAANTTLCSLLDCSKVKCAHASVQIAERLLGAHFCLQPPGDTATRRSTFDGFLSGCIPVFFSNESAYNQYTWHLPPDQLPPSSYSVLVPPAQQHRVLPLLSSFPTHRIARMRSVIVEELIPRLVYNSPHLATSHPTLRDAFHITLDGMLHRVAAKGWAKGG